MLAATGATLVVCPALLAGVWAAEKDRWRPDLDLTVAPYSSLCDRKENDKGQKLVVVPRPRPELKRQWDTKIADEAHYLKGRDTTWVKAYQKIPADREWLLTGTPILNYADELYQLCQILHPGDRRWTNYWNWVDLWFPVWDGRFGRKIGSKLKKGKTWEEFHEYNLGGVYLARQWSELGLELPPLTEQEIPVEMTPAQRRAYDGMKQDFIAEFPDGSELVSWSSGAQSVRLAQLTTGLELFGGIGSGKLDTLRELLRSWRGYPVVVACHFRKTAAVVAADLARQKLKVVTATGDVDPSERFARIERFQAGEGDVLVVTIGAVKEGVTLTRANRLVFVEKSYRPSHNRQMLSRIRRIGQSNPQLVVDLVARDSVDQRIRRVLAKKTDVQMKALRVRDYAALL